MNIKGGTREMNYEQIVCMLKQGYTIEYISEITGKSILEISNYNLDIIR